MNMEIFDFIGKISFAVLIAFGLIQYSSKKIFENYLLKRIENHKSNLERINISHEIQFASLHKERAIVIRELYQKLFDYKLVVIQFFNMNLDPKNEKLDLEIRINEWTITAPEFSTYFHKNRIYFSKELCEIIDNLINQLDVINKETQTFLRSFQLLEEQIQAIHSKDKRFIELKNKVNYYLKKDIEKISLNLEQEFRKILGVI
ncbi:hypothetical protein [Cognataquiflexum rubidum]|uniref:hypothetical protein n=1 Tax=Cognataquiflexum rubidum TaxID=2922273 RepID=UPI001F1461F5|nr:hypothetical protein [Cognataquiflexum rubidum]MCH6235790.1 hypothetical protein [Cognataquiflexum rubidum]